MAAERPAARARGTRAAPAPVRAAFLPVYEPAGGPPRGRIRDSGATAGAPAPPGPRRRSRRAGAGPDSAAGGRARRRARARAAAAPVPARRGGVPLPCPRRRSSDAPSRECVHPLLAPFAESAPAAPVPVLHAPAPGCCLGKRRYRRVCAPAASGFSPTRGTVTQHGRRLCRSFAPQGTGVTGQQQAIDRSQQALHLVHRPLFWPPCGVGGGGGTGTEPPSRTMGPDPASVW